MAGSQAAPDTAEKQIIDNIVLGKFQEFFVQRNSSAVLTLAEQIVRPDFSKLSRMFFPKLNQGLTVAIDLSRRVIGTLGQNQQKHIVGVFSAFLPVLQLSC